MIADARLTANSRPIARVVQECDLLRPLPIQTLTKDYWRFLSSSVFFDFGFGLFFFIFNLYLAAEHFDERSIGFFTSAFSVGSLVAAFPAGYVARQCGLRPLLATCLIGAPVAGAIRVFALSVTAQSIASFIFGITMCGWTICTPTVLARLTEDRNRSIGFSLNFAVGIGAGVAAGYIGGHLPPLLMKAGLLPSLASGMRVTLLLACAVVLAGVLPLRRRKFLAHKKATLRTSRSSQSSRRYLPQFLIAFATWSAVSAAFAPFINLYMARQLALPLPRIGEIFAMSQLLQVFAVLSIPALHRLLGMRHSIVAIQSCCAALLLVVRIQGRTPWIVLCFIVLNGLLYMVGPSLYALLMANTPDPQRSTASAAQSVVGSVVGVAGSAAAGVILVRSGYQTLFTALAALSIAAAILFGLTRGTGPHAANVGPS